MIFYTYIIQFIEFLSFIDWRVLDQAVTALLDHIVKRQT